MENYINRTEPDYRWQSTKVLNEPWGAIGHYELVSQKWRGHSWTHHLVIVRPGSIRNPDIAFLKISGDGDVENQINSLKTLAERSGAVTAVVINVPNQPFYEDRREDALIAYTFKQYLKNGDQALQTLAAFLELIADHKPLPKIAWKFNNVANIHINVQVESNEPAGAISLWSAHSDDLDFRNNQWTAQKLNITSG